MNQPPFEEGSQPESYEDALKSNIRRALSMVFSNWEIRIADLELIPIDSRAVDISDHAHPVSVFKAKFKIPREDFFIFSRRLINYKNVDFTKPNEFTVEIFVKISLNTMEALTEARGYSYVISLGKEFAIVQHLFPPTGFNIKDLGPNNFIELLILSIYDKNVRSLAQVPRLFTENFDLFFVPFLKSLAYIHGHGVTHGDMILRNVGYRSKEDEKIVFGFFDYTSVLSTGVMTPEELEDLPRVVANPNLLNNYSDDAYDLINEALVFNRKPSHEPFHLRLSDDQFTIASNILKTLILRDWEELINNSEELATFLRRAATSNLQTARDNILRSLEEYCKILGFYNRGLKDPKLKMAIQTLVNNRFTKALEVRKQPL